MAKINLGKVVDKEEWELIESVTLEEDTVRFVRTAEPDGTAYAFREMMLVVDFAATTTLSGNIPVYYLLSTGHELRSYFINPRDASRVKRGFSKIWIDHGYWISGWWSCTSEEGAYGGRSDNPWLYGREYAGSTGVIKQLMILSIPANSIIRIYGIRKE